VISARGTRCQKVRLQFLGSVVDVGSPAFVQALEDAVVAVMIEKASAVEHVEAMLSVKGWTWCSSGPPTTR
jgi:2-keto-3-deoxy-L-rhamnonate aldolase RhmA